MVYLTIYLDKLSQLMNKCQNKVDFLLKTKSFLNKSMETNINSSFFFSSGCNIERRTNSHRSHRKNINMYIHRYI